MSVARAEAELAAVQLIELMVAIAEADDDDEPAVSLTLVSASEPVKAVA